MNTIRLLALSFSLFFNFLTAEIQTVTLRWDPLLCKHGCASGFEKRLLGIQGVESLNMHADEGRVDLQWKRGVAFSFVPVNWALRYIGLRESDVRVKVKGSITGGGKNFALISEGDHTRFVLLNRAIPDSRNQYVTEFNKANRVLPEDLIAKLVAAQKRNLPVIIDGSLFMPERSPPDPLQLIVEQITVVENPKK